MIRICVFSLLLILTNGLTNLRPAEGQYMENRLDSMFSILNERGQFNGNALIILGGQRMHLGSYGLAVRDETNPVQISETNIFNIGSIAYIFTILAVLQLEEEGRIDTDDPVISYLPGFIYGDITIGHLLTQSAGMPAISEFIGTTKPTEIIDNRTVLDALYTGRPSLKSKPGLKSYYNPLDFIVLCELVEQISGLEFKEYLKKNIFLPADMKNTYLLDINESLIHRDIALGYKRDIGLGKYIPVLENENSGEIYNYSGLKGSGNIYSSIRDLYKLCQSVSENKVLNKNSFGELIDILPHIKDQSIPVPGWVIIDSEQGVMFLARGDVPGYKTDLLWNIQKNEVIILMSNENTAMISYQDEILDAINTFISKDKFYVPKLEAGKELSYNISQLTKTDIRNKIRDMKNDSEAYSFSTVSLKNLISWLEKNGDQKKSELIQKILDKEIKNR